VPCAGFIALTPPLSPVRKDIMMLTFITVRAVVSAPAYALREL